VAWFSAGAFVILGFPISMYGIVSHLANYNQPIVQVYVVRILWMVPIYSIESWLAMRFHKQAIYIETLRDLYESYVLYNFVQYLIMVLGGEEALILMLKDKSPTRGVHMWGLQWCVKPWLMGQPVRKISVYEQRRKSSSAAAAAVAAAATAAAAVAQPTAVVETEIPVADADERAELAPNASSSSQLAPNTIRSGRRAGKRVHWKSPFFIKCKFGVLQYVLLKFVSAIAVFILEIHGLYKEGDFTYKGGYLYICFLTNLSQCWALYCLIFFYYATKTELAPIRPVGKFLAVKLLVFFTWWQSVGISILYQMGLIPDYSYAETTWTKEIVAKAMQDYLICIEMFLAAIAHIFVFPHSEYTPQAVEARTRALSHLSNHPTKWQHKKKRLGRKYFWKDDGSKSSNTNDNHLGLTEMELATYDSGTSAHTAEGVWNDGSAMMTDSAAPATVPIMTGTAAARGNRSPSRSRTSSLDSDDSLLKSPSWEMEDSIMRPTGVGAIAEEDEDVLDDVYLAEAGGAASASGDSAGDSDDDDHGADSDDADTVTSQNPGFVRALIDSAIPFDLRDNAVGIVKGNYRIEKKTLLHHAATSDQYDIFSHRRKPFKRKPEAP